MIDHRRLRSTAAGLARLLTAALVIAFAGCDDADSRGDAPAPSPAAVTGRPAAAPVSEAGATVVFLGDSLTAGFGLGEDQAFPALVAAALAAEGRKVRTVNAGISGDTTAGGLARLDWLLKQQPAVLVVGLGGNDGLRGLDLAMSAANLRQIVERGQTAGAVVVLLGMQLPPNYGPDYTEAFAAIYAELADTYDVIHVPFLLEGVGGERHLNLPDGIHPNVEGHAIVARTVLPSVRTALDRAGS